MYGVPTFTPWEAFIAQTGLSIRVLFSRSWSQTPAVERHSMLSLLWVPSRGVEDVSLKSVGWISSLVRALNGSVASDLGRYPRRVRTVYTLYKLVCSKPQWFLSAKRRLGS